MFTAVDARERLSRIESSRPRMEANPCHDNLAFFFLERLITSTAALHAANS
jgi:hypothetical protein